MILVKRCSIQQGEKQITVDQSKVLKIWLPFFFFFFFFFFGGGGGATRYITHDMALYKRLTNYR